MKNYCNNSRKAKCKKYICDNLEKKSKITNSLQSKSETTLRKKS